MNSRVMMNRSFCLLLALVFSLSVLARAQDGDDDDEVHVVKPPVMKATDKPTGLPFACPYERDFQRAQKFGPYTLRLLPIKRDKDDRDKDNDSAPRCRAVLTSPSGKRTRIAEDWALTVDKISGGDLNGDGKPDLVLDGYSGGLHCCYTHLVISLGRTPRILHAFRNQAPMTFERQPDGSTLIRAADGVFDYFLVPHAEAVIPQLVLRVQGNDLVDVSANFPELYDPQIENARTQLSSPDLEKFRNANYHDKLFMDQVPTVQRVLTIVLNYLYSGREEKAWEALNQFWPAPDSARVKSLIMERRRRGLLANLACTCRPAVVAQRPRRPRPPKPPVEDREHSTAED
jgi:hypothetical protein